MGTFLVFAAKTRNVPISKACCGNVITSALGNVIISAFLD